MGRICGCLTQSTVNLMLESAFKSNCDILEARLDFLIDTFDIHNLNVIEKPLISTCMPEWENGNFKKDESKRLKLLIESLEFTDYVTIELNTKKELIDDLVRKAREKNVKVIIAYHDFEQTPTMDDMQKIIDKEFELGADIAKIACKPHSHQDVLDMMSLLKKQEPNKTIFLSMDKMGQFSRVIGPILGSFLTYASIDDPPAGPGQLSVDELNQIKKIMWE